jgi:WD40 repeat protein
MARGLRLLCCASGLALLLSPPGLGQPPAGKDGARVDLCGDPLPDGALCRLGSYRFRHGEFVLRLQFTADGRKLLSLGESTCCLWELPSGRLLARYDVEGQSPAARPPRPGPVRVRSRHEDWLQREAEEPQAVLSPDGRLLACEVRGAVRLLDAATGKLLASFRGTSSVVGFTGDSKTLTGVDHRRILHQWDVRARKELRAVQLQFAHGPPLLPVGLSCAPDGKTLADWRLRPVVRRWDTASGRELPPLKGHGKPVLALAFSGDGGSLASLGMDGTVRLWDASGKEVRRWPTDPVWRPVLALAPDGKTLALAGTGATGSLLRLCDRARGQGRFLFQKRPHAAALTSLAFSPDGRALAGVNVLGEIAFWRLDKGGAPQAEQPAPSTVGGPLLYTHDGKGLFAGHLHHTALWDLGSGKPVRTYPGAVPWDLSPDHKHLATVAVQEPPPAWDLDEHEVSERLEKRGFWLRILPVGGGRRGWRTRLTAAFDEPTVQMAPRGFDAEWQPPVSRPLVEPARFSADGRGVLVGRPSKQAVEILDLHSGKKRATWKCGDGELWSSSCMALSADRKWAAFLASPGGAQIRDLTSGRPGVVCAAPKELFAAPLSLSFSPDGKCLAMAVRHLWEEAEPVETLLWEARTGKLRHRFHGRTDLGWTADGSMLLLTGKEPAGFWSAETGNLVRACPPAGEASRAAFSPDGRYVALVADEVWRWELGVGEHTGPRPITLVEVATGAAVRTFKGHRKAVYALAFGPDSRTFATASLDGTALVWDVTGRLHDGRLVPPGQAPRDFEEHWGALRSADAGRAHRAVWALVAAGDGAVAHLERRLKPAGPVERKELAKWLAGLDSKRFKERQRAVQALLELDAARPALRESLARTKGSLEVRRRLQGVIEKLADPAGTAERLRAWRALQVLEQVGTPKARALLEALAAGAPEAHLTQQARQSLSRLARLNRSGAGSSSRP